MEAKIIAEAGKLELTIATNMAVEERYKIRWNKKYIKC